MRVLSSSWALLATLASATGAGGGNGIFRASRCLTGSHNCHDDAVCTYATGSTTPQCTCRRGFVGDGFTCSDLDECATFRHDCTFDETCVNTEGGFYCKKRENADGSRLTLPGQACFDGTNTCHHLATCVPDNNLQGYDCICHEGFYGNGGGIGPGAPGCHDIDECLTVNECNSQGSTCVNTFGSYICKKNPDPAMVCQDNADCDSLAMCVPDADMKRGYNCVCKDGFKGNGNAKMSMDQRDMALIALGGSSRGCKDIDECAAGSHNCFGQTCVNTPGAYFCTVNQDPWAVCADGAHTCHEHAICMPSTANRGYDCYCKAGYEGNGNTEADFWSDQRGKRGCHDIDECRSKQHNCIHQNQVQQCVNVQPEEGGFICVDLIAHQTCADAGLDASAICIDAVKYSCHTYNTVHDKTNQTLTHTACVDVDECKAKTDTCTPDQSCVNELGSFSCLGLANINDVCSENPCPTGYTCADSGDGWYDCLPPATPDPCDGNTCADSGVEFICMVINNAGICTNVTEHNNDPYKLCTDYYCGENMECGIDTSDYKSRVCTCVIGYTDDNGDCVDEDECVTNAHTCDVDTHCKNTLGSYLCLDDDGLSDWWCALKPGICGSMDSGANCTATEAVPGSPVFRCQCSDGYTQTDEDADPAVSPHLAQCRDRIDCYPGSTFCGEDFCIEEVGFDATCTNSTDPLNLCNGKSPCGVHGDCSLSDDKKERICDCHVGFTLEPVVPGSDAMICTDTDECKLHADFGDDKCSLYETCVNTPGSYYCDAVPDPFGVCAGANNPCLGIIGATCLVDIVTKRTGTCVCEAGFSFTNNECQDIDECAGNNDNCKQDQTCANVPGGFFCVDNDGPCAAGQHTCHSNARCVPSYAKRGYDCQCLVGYHGKGEAPKNRTMEAAGIIAMGPNGPSGCADNDECEGGAHNCHPEETCQNTEGSYTCSLEYDPFGVCNSNAHDCHPLAACTPVFPNGKAGHACTCRSGYQGSGQVCVNQNECALGLHDCSAHQICVDVDGGFNCVGVQDPLNACDSHDCNDLSHCRADPNMEAGYKCVDKNECLENTHGCSINQSCINVNYGAGYVCIGQADTNNVCRNNGPADRHCQSQNAECVVANTFSGYKCVDIDECADPANNPCAGNALRTTCKNKNPGYTCVDAAQDEFLVCMKVNCGDNAECSVNADGNAVCTCNQGYTAGIDMNICVDVDECSEGTLNDCIGTTCVNTAGGWHCDNGDDPFALCVAPNNNCADPTACAVVGNNKDVRECMCEPGFAHPNDNGVVNLEVCEDVNECDNGTANCLPGQTCVNTAGTFVCSAEGADPYDLCESEDSVGKTSCRAMGDALASCNIVGDDKNKFTCVCSAPFFSNKLVDGPGYETCEDVNECDDPNTCADGSICINQVGSHTCDNTADPFNVCAEGAHRCGSGANACVPGVDSYTCDCKGGFRQMIVLPHAQCVDIDECSDATHNCLPAAGQICTNLNGNEDNVGVLGATDQDANTGTVTQGFKCEWQSLVDPHGVCNGPDALMCFGLNSFCVVSTADQRDAFCSCPDGFFYEKSKGCTDINECDFAGLNTCTFNQLCVNTVGSFECVKNNDPFGHCSGNDKCHPKAVCTPGSPGNDFMCHCVDGYEGDGLLKAPRAELEAEEKGKNKKNRGCRDVNECQRGMDHCQSIGKFCVNTEGSYQCVEEASMKHPCGNGAHDCHHLARCEVSPTSKSGYMCKCNHGFQGHGRESKRALTGEVVAAGTPRGCADVNECKFGHHNCALGQFCHNTIGGFKCMGVAQSPTPCDALQGTPQECGAGMKCIHNDNGSPKCVDIDECIVNADSCAYGKTCVNTVGSFNCLANVPPSDPCDSNPCNDDTKSCVSLGSTFACLDKDECLTQNTCLNGEVCYNMDDGYLCIPDPTSVCGHGSHGCHANAVCIPNGNNKKGYDCVCNSGYYGNGNKGSARMSIADFARSASGPRGCEDINECNNSAANNCDDKVCINTPGSYYCAVNVFPGENEGEQFCKDGNNNCDVTEDCISDENNKHGYRCECKAGFDRKNGKCKDIDECEKETHNCLPLQVCWNQFGDFKCLGDADPLNTCASVDCGAGFWCVAYANRQGYKCVDKNECTDGDHTCTDGQTCINFAGSFACKSSDGPAGPADPCETHQCAPGTRCQAFDTKPKCVGINECVEEVHPCPWGEICINEANGHSCIPDLKHVCSSKKSRCGAHSTCVPLGAGNKNYACVCDAGYQGNKDDGCEDINECLDHFACKTEEYCINTAGSFVCFDQEVVQNEYETPCDENDCDINAECVVNYHLEREYECVCNNGYRGDGVAKYSKRTLIANGQDKGCVNVDECKEGTHTCGTNQGCVDTTGGFDCKEDPFGVCAEDAHSCNLGSVCQPKPGQLWDYECICREGFVDSCMAKCGTTWSFCYRTCMNEVGKGNYCTDVDECELELDDCHTIVVDVAHNNTDHVVSIVGTHDTTCVNTPGNFYCTTLLDPLGHCDSWENNDCDNSTTVCTIDETNRLEYTCEPKPGFFTNGDGEVVNINECTHAFATEDECAYYPDTYACPVTQPGDDRCRQRDALALPLGTWCVDKDGSDGEFFECVDASEDPYNVCTDNPCGINPRSGEAFPCSVVPTNAHEYACDCFPENDGVSNLIQLARVSDDGLTCVDYENCNTSGAFKDTGLAGMGEPCDKDLDGNGVIDAFCVEKDMAAHECSDVSDPYDVCKDVDCGLGECRPVQPARTDYKCHCPNLVGYMQEDPDLDHDNDFAAGSKSKCMDIDECTLYAGVGHPTEKCQDPASDENFCMNTLGSWACTNLDDPYGACADINTCGPNGECTLSNDRKEAICGCRSGFTDICEDACEFSIVPSCYEQCIASLHTQQRCQNINECDKKNPTHTCLTTEECFDIEGSFLCRNQCQLTNPCDENATCTADYSKDGFTCACNTGYHGDGINQSPGKSPLPEDIDLDHLVGFGQKKNKESGGCQDIDECALKLHNCDVSKGELCINTLFNAETGMGYECNAEADPFGACAFNAHDCHPLAACVVDQMAEEGYVCECNAGYYGNGKFHFIDVNGRKRRSDEDPFAAPYGADEWWTPAPYDPNQRTTNNDVKGCLDVDECHYDLHDCVQKEACYNSVGSFYCVDDFTTVAPDVTVELVECFINGIECDKAGICYMDPLATQSNGYNCKCPSGFRGNGVVSHDERGGKNRGCEDIDECEEGTDSCQSWNSEFCKNTEGGFECLTNTMCAAGETYPCYPGATCTEVGMDKFTCECPEGLKGNGKGAEGCGDVDECSSGHSCHESAHCINVFGGYECRCAFDSSLVDPLQPCDSLKASKNYSCTCKDADDEMAEVMETAEFFNDDDGDDDEDDDDDQHDLELDDMDEDLDVVAEVGSDADLFPDIGAIGGDDGDNDNNNMNQHDQENQDDLEKAIMKARADADQDSVMGLASMGDEDFGMMNAPSNGSIDANSFPSTGS